MRFSRRLKRIQWWRRLWRQSIYKIGKLKSNLNGTVTLRQKYRCEFNLIWKAYVKVFFFNIWERFASKHANSCFWKTKLNRWNWVTTAWTNKRISENSEKKEERTWKTGEVFFTRYFLVHRKEKYSSSRTLYIAAIQAVLSL